MGTAASPSNLSAEEGKELQDILARFALAWQGKDRVDLAKFLPPTGKPLRAIALIELIKLDLESRGRRGQEVSLASYLEKFPELGSARTLKVELIYQEYRIRHLFGDKPALAVYRNRFSDQFPELEKLVRAHPIEVVTRAGSIEVDSLPLSRVGMSNDTGPIPVDETGPPAKPPVAPKAEPAKPEKPKTGKEKHTAGAYTLTKRIGSGGFGEVWLGEAPGGFKVAIKLIFRPLDHEESQREKQSLELIKELRHPFLLQTQSYFPHDDRLYIIMELAEGSLRDRLKECRKTDLPGIPVGELITYMRESAEALDFLHSRNVLHRDIKPENILVLQRHAKVADFGLAREQEGQHLQSATGSGTPIYMAPEVWRNKSSPHSDQYSLALTYTELRLDRRIISGSDLMQIMFDHMERTPDLSPLTAEEQAPILRALSKDPDKRYPNCRDFVRALEKAVALEHVLVDRPLSVPDGYHLSRSKAGSVADGMATLNSGIPGMRQSGERTIPLESQSGSRGWRNSKTSTELEVPPPVARRTLVLGIAFAVIGLFALGVTGVIRYRQMKAPPVEAVATEAQPLMPAGCEAEEGAEVKVVNGQRYYNRIVKVKGELKIPFVLIPQSQPSDPATFYLMENKVSNEQFLAATKDPEFKALLEKHSKEMPWILKRNWEKMKSFEDHKDWPVTNVTVTEAHCFADWLGGQLPSVEEWNKATGYYEPDRLSDVGKFGDGPYRSPWNETDPMQVAVNRKSKDEPPLPVGKATHDISYFGCRDMAGNGEELTRTISENSNPVPLAQVKEQTSTVLLRGRDIRDAAPLKYEDIKGNRAGTFCYYEDATNGVSFRVALRP